MKKKVRKKLFIFCTHLFNCNLYDIEQWALGTAQCKNNDEVHAVILHQGAAVGAGTSLFSRKVNSRLKRAELDPPYGLKGNPPKP